MAVVEDRAEGFGAKIRELRLALDMSQADLAEAAGVRQSTIHRLETGQRLPSYSLLLRLADALRTDPGYLTR
jgi:transcriptional regulator with XRE-family HTH domain